MTELGYLALVLATSFSLVRVFGDYGFLGRTWIVAIVAAAFAALLRRRGVGSAVAIVVHSVVGIVFLTNLYFGQSTTFGLPTGATIRAISNTVPPALGDLSSAVPPVEATTGILFVVGAAIWVLCLFGDIAAAGVRATVQAALPLGMAFLALGVPDSDIAEVQSVVVFGIGLAIYAIGVNLDHDRSVRWVGGEEGAARGSVRIAASTLPIALVALLAAAITVAVVPARRPLVKIHNQTGERGREVATPYIGIRSLLGEQSNAEMFSVTTNKASYWRTTALDTYDPVRDIWVSSGRYDSIRGDLSRGTAPAVDTTRITQQFTVADMGGPWVPAAFEPVRFSGDPQVSFNSATSTLFAEDDLGDGQTYDITSEAPDFSARSLRRSSGLTSTEKIDPRLLETPPESRLERAVLEDLASASSSRYDALLATQSWFREQFDYDLDVDYSESEDPVTEFLIERRGFCQQFSSVFALFARRLGLASRVAVGFTMGEEDQAHDGPADTKRFVVRGLHAHAWPEVYFPGVGWVPFEPTPGRGNPATTQFTGVESAQATASPTPESTTTTTTPTTTTDPSQAGATPTTQPPDVIAGPDADQESTGPISAMLIAVLLGLATVIIATGTVFWLRRRPVPGHGPTVPADPVSDAILVAWESAQRALGRLGLHTTPSQTPVEFANHVANNLATSPTAGSLLRLAEIETIRRYSAEFHQGAHRDNDMAERLVDESHQRAHDVEQWVESLLSETVPSATRSN